MRLATLAAPAAVLALGLPAFGQISAPGQHRFRLEVEVHGTLNAVAYHYGEGLGGGFRIGIPLLRNGPIRSINNDLTVTLGADLLYNRSGPQKSVGLHAPGALQWNFFLSPRWSVFGELGLFFGTVFDAGYCLPTTTSVACETSVFSPLAAAGARWHLGGMAGNFPAVIVRVGYPTGINLGVSF